MTSFTSLVVAGTSVSVAPTLTELERFSGNSSNAANAVSITLENLDGVQALSGGYRTRPNPGSGTWSTVADDALSNPPIAPGESRSIVLNPRVLGEVSVFATASGAGLSCKYSRREAVDT